MYRHDPMFANWLPIEFTFGGGWWAAEDSDSPIPGMNTCRAFQNLYIGVNGIPVGRYGYLTLTTGAAVAITGPVVGLGNLVMSDTRQFLTFVDKGAARWCDHTTPRVIVSGLTATSVFNPCFTTYKNLQIMTWAGNNPKRYDGFTGADLGGTPPQADFCLTHGERLWLFNSADSKGYFCAPGDETSWDAANWSETFGAGDGGVITGAISHGQRLYVFKTNGIWMLLGYPSSTGEIAYTKAQMVHGVGCAAPASLVQVGSNFFFFASDGSFHVYSGGANTNPISAPIQDFIQNATLFDMENRGASIAGAHLPKQNRILWTFAKSPATTNSNALMYDLGRGGTWAEWTNHPFRCLMASTFASAGTVYAGTDGTTNRAIAQLGTPDPSDLIITDSLPAEHTPITITAQSDFRDLGYSYVQKQAQHLIVEATGTVSSLAPATVTIYTRNGTTEKTTTVSIPSLPWSNGVDIDGTWESVSVKYDGPEDTKLKKIILYCEPVSTRTQ